MMMMTRKMMTMTTMRKKNKCKKKKDIYFIRGGCLGNNQLPLCIALTKTVIYTTIYGLSSLTTFF